ncbi:hypothetical protein N7488_010158 [Penicillium malachiteum]|nr:hypothetical protein N7488_010158 [Penicillium malachiteum]
MYEPATTLNLQRLSRQSLQKRYESDEEDVSESDAGGPDFVPSLVGSQRAGTIDSDLSADENSHTDPDSDREERILPSYHVAKRPRPVSMDTVKRNSTATFVESTRVFDPEDDLVLELPLPESTPELASDLYLQPSIYVSPNTPPTTHQRSRSPSPASIFSLENAEIHVAKKITLMEPQTRPTLVFIKSLGTRSKDSRLRHTQPRTRGNARNRESRIFDGKLEGNIQVPRLTDVKSTSSPRIPERTQSPHESTNSTPYLAQLEQEDTSTSLRQSATINCVSDIPVLPYFPPSPEEVSASASFLRPRPRTSGCEKQFPTAPTTRTSRRPTDPIRRPPSTRSNSNTSLPAFSPRPASPFPTDEMLRNYISDHNSEGTPAVPSRTCSPISASSPPQQYQYIHSSKRGPIPSNNGNSNILPNRSPMMRRMTRKHSAASSIHSLSSLRSEMDLQHPPQHHHVCSSVFSASTQSVNTVSYDARPTRKASQRRHARHASSAVGSGRGFMGLKLGKRAFSKV